MTIHIVYNGVTYSDKRASCLENGRPVVLNDMDRKIHIEDGKIGLMSGSARLSELCTKAFMYCGAKIWDERSRFSSLIIDTETKEVSVIGSAYTEPEVLTGDFIAIGSGAGPAVYAHEQGLAMSEVLWVVATVDPFVGRNFDIINLHSGVETLYRCEESGQIPSFKAWWVMTKWMVKKLFKK